MVRGDQRTVLVLGPMKDQPQRRLLSCVEPQHFRQQHGAEALDGRTDRHTDSLGAQRQELDRKSRRRPVVAGVLGPRGSLVVAFAGPGQPRQVALHVGHQHRDARRAELLGDQLQRLGLAGSGGPRHQAMPVDGGQRDTDLRRRIRRAVDDDRSQFQCLAVDGVAVGDPRRGRRR